MANDTEATNRDAWAIESMAMAIHGAYEHECGPQAPLGDLCRNIAAHLHSLGYGDCREAAAEIERLKGVIERVRRLADAYDDYPEIDYTGDVVAKRIRAALEQAK